MDETDKSLLNRIQSNFPVSPRPFSVIADEFNLSEEEVIRRVRRMKSDGIIRRIGGNFVPGKLGYVSTLCAAKVPEEKISTFAETVNRYTGVTHNYVRDNAYNVWFTFIAPSMPVIENYLAEIAEKTGVNEIINLPATHLFKIKAHFNL
jgi:DNA-binding Lrp family transcriptional regulator